MDLKELDIFIKSGIPIVCIRTSIKERIKVIKKIYDFAKNKNIHLALWNPGWEIFKEVECNSDELYFYSICDNFNLNRVSKIGAEIFNAFDYVLNCQSSKFFILEYSFQALQDKSPFLFQTKLLSQINNVYYELEKYNRRKPNKILIFMTTESEIPYPLNSLIPTINTPLPRIEEIPNIIQDYLKIPQDINISGLVNACSGLNSEEIRSGCALARASLQAENLNTPENSKENIALIADYLRDYKISRFKDMGLNFVDTESLSDFGGFDLLRKFIHNVKFDFSPEARRVNIPLPKGCLLVGPPGTGKTLCARVSAKFLGFPLISVDTALTSVAGASYLKGLIERVEAAAPCVLFFDEFDKFFNASVNTGEDKNSRSVLAILLTWLQDKKSKVFVIATLNRLDALPPELTRIGRFDEIFWVGFPQAKERKEILSLHLSRFDPRYKNADPLTPKEWRIILNKTLNLTGAELARCVEKAARDLFHQGKKIVIGLDELLKQREQIVSLFSRDADRILAIENQAKSFSQPASSPDNSEFAPTLQSYWGSTVR